MIIVTANVGLLPFEIGKKRAYSTDKRVGFFSSAGPQLNLRRFHPSQASNIKFEQRKNYRWASQPWMPTGKRSGLRTHIAMTISQPA